MEDLSGLKILNYRIRRIIGQGGMTTVYEAQHETFATERWRLRFWTPY